MCKAERHLLPNGTEITYYDETHTYMINGKEVPSITTLIRDHYGDKYEGVDPEVLKKASEYGTKVHAELQQAIDLRNEDPVAPFFCETPEANNYFNQVEKIYKINPKFTEKVVALYDPNNNIVACGRLDLICDVAGDLTIADFKTTYSVNRQYVSAQLNLYATAARQSGYINNEEYNKLKLGVIHLHGSVAKYVPVVKFAEDFYLQFII